MSNDEGTDYLLGMVVVGRNIIIWQEEAKLFFLIDTVGKCFTDSAVTGNLIVFGFYPRKVSVNFDLKHCLTVFLSVCNGKVIKFIIGM